MSPVRRATIAALLTGMALLVGYLLYQDRPAAAPAGGIPAGAPAPDFTLVTATGEAVRLSDFRGRPVVLNFWATWCPPCRAEMPDLQALYDTGRDRGLVVLGVNLQESAVAVSAFATRYNLAFPLALDTDGAVARLYGILPLPTTYFIDATGRVRSRVQGQAPPAVLRRETDRLWDADPA